MSAAWWDLRPKTVGDARAKGWVRLAIQQREDWAGQSYLDACITRGHVPYVRFLREVRLTMLALYGAVTIRGESWVPPHVALAYEQAYPWSPLDNRGDAQAFGTSERAKLSLCRACARYAARHGAGALDTLEATNILGGHEAVRVLIEGRYEQESA